MESSTTSNKRKRLSMSYRIVYMCMYTYGYLH